MSFGFSIGDIIILSQLSYRLYSAVTSGRSAASRDLEELKQALFSLHCSLGHLENTAGEILQKAANGSNPKASVLKDKLDVMVKSCSATLQELDDATREYRELASKEPGPRWSQAQLKAQYKRVVWEFKGRSLSEYRQKLQLHTDAINLVLTTFIWSTTNDIHDSSKKQVEMLEGLLSQGRSINDNSYELLKDIHSLLKQRNTDTCGTRSIEHMVEDHPSTPNTTRRLAVRQRPAMVEVAAVNFTADFTSQVQFHVSEDSQISHATHFAQPPRSDQAINAQRSLVGKKEFEAFLKKYQAPTVYSKPSFMQQQAPTIQQLLDGIDYILRPIHSPVTSQEVVDPQIRMQEVVHWVHGLDHRSTLITSRSGSDPNDLVKVLVSLNNSLEKSDDTARKIFYSASESRIDQALARLQLISRRCAQAIEEFEDERADWLGK